MAKAGSKLRNGDSGAARSLGSKGGKSTSPRKQAAARSNGKKRCGK